MDAAGRDELLPAAMNRISHGRNAQGAGGANRIISLLPSATEIVCALGLEDRLVGVTHECDFPPVVSDLPHVTRSRIPTGSLASRDIDAAVRDALADGASIYELDDQLVEELRPDLILSQQLCEVCAVGPDEVRRVTARLLDVPDVVSLEPRTLSEVFDSILLVGALAGAQMQALELVRDAWARLEAVRALASGGPRRRVATLEWLVPPFSGGHWVPEMVEIAGGHDGSCRRGQPSPEITWEDVMRADPDVIVAMLCGFDLVRSQAEVRGADLPPEWNQLRAVQAGEVYVTDGSAYFSRPGPRLVEGVEILASILHPSADIPIPENSVARLSAAPAGHGRRVGS